MKTLKYFLLFFLTSIFLILSCQKEKNTNKKEKSQRPNIVFIMSDDHSFKAISAYGNKLNQTPNIDKIGKQGAIFNKGFVTNSICAPSRAVILTGKFSHLNGKVDNFQAFDWNQDNFAKDLQKAGYQTALIGKIHLNGLPQGFDYSNVLEGQGQYYNPDFIENGKKKRIHGYVTQITTNIALDWLQNKRKKDKPFLLLLQHKAPHRPWMPEAKYLGYFDHKTFTPPKNFFDDYKGRPAAATNEMEIDRDMDVAYDLKMYDKENEIKTRLRGFFKGMYDRMDEEQSAKWDAYYNPIIHQFKKANLQGKKLALWKYDRYMKDYLSTIKSVDDSTGEILKYLEDNGLSKNTIVVYTSDQGFYLGEHGWFDKRFMYEESFRTPIFVRYPKEIKSGSVINELVQNLDFAPTFLDYAGVSKPKDMQGESFRGLLNGKNVKWRDAIYYHYYEYPAEHHVMRHYGLRTNRYKLIHFYYDLDEWELYDLEKDPTEMNNIYQDTAYREVKEMMHKKLKELRLFYKDNDSLDQANIKRYLDKKGIKQ